MSIQRRIEELEAEAMRQGYDALSARMGERVSQLSSAELASLSAQLEHYCRTGEAAPGLIETIKELTQP